MKTDMKIKIRDRLHCQEVQEQLFKEGFGWRGDEKFLQYTYATHLFAAANGGYICYISDGDEEYFSDYKSEEHFLITDAQGARFVTKDYWTQPATANIPERYKNPVTDTDKAMKAAYDTVCEQLTNSVGGSGYFSFHKDSSETTYEPLGITPRVDFLRSRNVEILQAMLRYTEANMTIPSTWFLELEDNNEELDNEQN